MHAFVTGAAGFVGSNLVDRLLEQGHTVTGYDNLSTGFAEFLEGAQTKPAFRLITGDLLGAEMLATAMRGCDTVFHLAANADVRFGLSILEGLAAKHHRHIQRARGHARQRHPAHRVSVPPAVSMAKPSRFPRRRTRRFPCRPRCMAPPKWPVRA